MEAFESHARSGVLCDIVPVQKKILHTVTTPAPRPQKKSQKRGMRMIAVFAIILILGTTSLIAQADFGALYASTCEGGWANMEKAAGAPDLKDQTDPGLFTDTTSASWNGSDTAGIICKGFDGIPNDAHVLSARVGISWVFKTAPAPVVAPTPVSAPTEDIPPAAEPAPNSDVAPSEVAPIPASEPAPTPEPTPTPAPAPEQTPETIPAPAPAQEQAAPQPAPVESSIQTLLRRFTSVAHADDGVPQITATLAFNGLKDFIAIEYSSDGTTWMPVASADLEIPIESISELKHLQVRIRTLRTGADLPQVYVDSVWLDVKYRAGDGSESSDTSSTDTIVDDVINTVSDIPQAIADIFSPQTETVAIETTGAPSIPVVTPQPVVVFGFSAAQNDGLLASIRSMFGKTDQAAPTVTIDPDKQSLSIEWQCTKRYGTLLLIQNPADLENDPAKAIINRANECEGGHITHRLQESELPRTLESGTYVLFAADQDELGAWTMHGKGYPMSIERTVELK